MINFDENTTWKPKVGDWFLLKASYCSAEDNPKCTDNSPCDDCLKMCNKFIISSSHCDKDFFFGGGWCNRDGGHIADETFCYVLTTDKTRADGIGGVHHISEALPILDS